MTREEFISEVTKQAATVAEKYGIVLDAPKILKLKNGWRALYLRPVGEKTFSLDYRATQPNRLTVLNEVQGRFNTRMVECARIAI